MLLKTLYLDPDLFLPLLENGRTRRLPGRQLQKSVEVDRVVISWRVSSCGVRDWRQTPKREKKMRERTSLHDGEVYTLYTITCIALFHDFEFEYKSGDKPC